MLLDDEPSRSSLPSSWLAALGGEFHAPSFSSLRQFLAAERQRCAVFPPAADLYRALIETPLENVRVVIVGQDPYHDDAQAMGLAFSVPPGVALPPSLRNIFRELQDDLGQERPASGCLLPWARQGVLLLNTVLTVRAHEAGSHRKRGWEPFTDAILKAVNAKADPVVFALWGADAQKKRALVDETRHLVIASAHPSPLSASRGFFGSKPFSRSNAFLRENGRGDIDWRLSVDVT
jgi:uracil-DNA glycosylase